MANCIKLKLARFDERDVQLTEWQCINTTAAISTTTFSAAMNTTMPKGMKMKFSGKWGEEKGELNEDTPSVCRLSKERKRKVLEQFGGLI